MSALLTTQWFVLLEHGEVSKIQNGEQEQREECEHDISQLAKKCDPTCIETSDRAVTAGNCNNASACTSAKWSNYTKRRNNQFIVYNHFEMFRHFWMQ